MKAIGILDRLTMAEARDATMHAEIIRQAQVIRALEAKIAAMSYTVIDPQSAPEPLAIRCPPVVVDHARMTDICAAVAAVYGVPVDRMKAKFGPGHETDARAEFCRLAVAEGFTLAQIGGFLGGRDTSTVLHLARRAGGVKR